MTSFNEAVKAVRQHAAGFQLALKSWPAYLGDGSGNVFGTQRKYYNCRYPTKESPSVEVYAGDCPPWDGLQVRVGYSADQPNFIRILSWGDSSQDNSETKQVPYHAEQHAYLGGDTVWIDWRQITTFRVQPYNGLVVYVNGGVLPRSGTDLEVLPVLVDLTASVPSSSGQGRYALLSVDSNGAIVVTDGTPVTPSLSLDAADVPSTPAGNFRIAAVQLAYGQTSIVENLSRRDILDLRWPQETIAGSPYALFGTQTANTVLAGPTTGAAALPAFRGLVAADLPTHDIVSLHTTSGRTTGQVLQATGATTFGWSTNTLTLTGSLTVGGTSSINGTAIVGTPGTLTVSTTNAAADPHTHAITTSTVGAASTIMATDANGYARAVRFGAGLATSPTLPLHVGGGGGAPVTSGTTQTYGQIRIQNGDGALDIGQYSNGDTWLQNCAPSSLGTSRNIILNPNGGRIGVGTASPSYQVHLYQNADTSSNSIWIQNASTGTAAISSLLIGQTLTGNKYGQWFATGTNYTSGLKALPALGMAFFTSTGMTGGMSFINYANAPIYFATQGADISVIRLTISGAGNIGAGTVMEGAGVTYQKFNVNGSQLFVGTTSTQEREMVLEAPIYTISTDASRTVLHRGTTTGNAVNSGYYGAWAHNAVANTAITIIPDGTGDVTAVGSFVYTIKDNTASTTSGGVVTLNPSGGAVTLLSDGTDTCQITCAANGSVTIARSAGTHTFSVSIWGTWQ